MMRRKGSGSIIKMLCGLPGVGAAIFLGVMIVAVAPQRAQALPSYARQTGQPCGQCHTDFPQLTPFGRRFKLGGYTLGGGQESDTYKKAFGSDAWVPPISMMALLGYTHTQAPQNDAAAGTAMKPNDNVVAQAFSVFYGGAITENLGAFVQGTIGSTGFDPNRAVQVNWDNADIRYVHTGQVAGVDYIVGVTAHNNPTVQDVWNTLPAWGFPFVFSNLQPLPTATTLIDGTFAQHVAGVGAYTFINDIFYLEATGYKTLNPRVQNSLGIAPTDAPGLMNGVSPYFRVAAEPHWGNHWLEVGAFAFLTSLNPFSSPDTDWSVFSGTDRYTDLGADAQYQYMGDDHLYSLTLRAVYIYEKQRLEASFANGLAANPTDQLNTFRAQASFAYGTDKRIIFTGGYFNTWGTPDMGLYADHANFSPNSDGWIAEIAFIPFGMNRPELWPWFNARIGLQYVWYNKFNGASTNYDGNGHNASDNNTLYAYLWIAM